MPKSHGFDFQHCIHTMKYQCCFSSAKFPSSPSPHQLLTQQSQASKMEQTSPPIFQNILPGIDDKNHSQQRILQRKKTKQKTVSVNLRNQRMNSSKKKFCISQAFLIHAFILHFLFFSLISVLVLQPRWVHPISPMGGSNSAVTDTPVRLDLASTWALWPSKKSSQC